MKTALYSFTFWIGAGAGGAVIWFGKDWILKTILGAEAFANKIQAKATAITSAIKK